MRLKQTFNSFLHPSRRYLFRFPCKPIFSTANTWSSLNAFSYSASRIPFFKKLIPHFIPQLRCITFHLPSKRFPLPFTRQNERSSVLTVTVRMATAKLNTLEESSESISSDLPLQQGNSVTDTNDIDSETGLCQSEQDSLKDKAIVSPTAAPQQLSKRAQKKNLKREKLKALRKAKHAPNYTKNSSPGFDINLFGETDYYFENGLRKVYPYPFTFSTSAKERWYGRTIQDVFENEFRVDSPDNFRKSVAKGNMRVNAEVVGLDYVLRNGDLIEHHVHRHENPVCGQPIEIIEDTPELVVINKPSSIPCHPCGKFRFNSIVFIMGKEFGYANLRNIYRLDRLTSGVLIMGKTAKKTKELENQVLHRKVHKEYVARVIGEFPEGEVEVKQPLSCLSHKLTLWQVDAGGKPSHTSFRRMSYNGKTSLVKCIPHTGRTHQIRVHLQYLGHPIVNDPFYNSPAWGPLRRKGGHCDVSHEEICSKIMQEHNVGLWCEGENPLFTEKLSAVNSDSTEASTASPAGNGQSHDSHSLLSSPLPKRAKLASDVNISTEGESCTASDSDALQSSDWNPAFSEKLGGDSCHSNAATSVSTPTCNLHTAESRGGGEVKNSSGSDVCSKESLKEVHSGKVEQKQFDPKRWTPDPLCESCRLKYIEPKPTDLLLYLHAVRYKGPTWDYSARLPAWAQDEWEEPPEYQKYFS